MKKNILLKIFFIVVFLFASFNFAFADNNEDSLNFVAVVQGGHDNPFWGVIEKGMHDAANLLGVKIRVYRPDNEGDLEWQLSTFRTVMVNYEDLDGIITSIPDANMFDDLTQEAIDLGIPVIAINTDDPDGKDGNARLAYVGQNYYSAGFAIAEETMKRFFNEEPPKHVLIPAEILGIQYSNQRGKGIIDALKQFGAESYEMLETTMDPAESESRIMSYLTKHPETEAIICLGGIAFPPAARAAARVGYKPGEIKITGFDLMPPIIDQMRQGYIQLTLDQQPYLQGFIPVLQLQLINDYKFDAWDQDTGKYVVTPDQLDDLEELSAQRVRN